MPKVFVSHSSKTDAAKEKLVRYCTEVQGLLDPGFNLFYDHDIATGSDWHQKILVELCECQVFVLLLTQSIFESDWVRLEAAYSGIRRMGEPHFKMIVVPFEDGVSAEDVEKCPLMGGVAKVQRDQFTTANLPAGALASRINAVGLGADAVTGKALKEVYEVLLPLNSGSLLSKLQEMEASNDDQVKPSDKIANWCQHAPAQALAIQITKESEKAIRRFQFLLEIALRMFDKSNASHLLQAICHLWVPDPVIVAMKHSAERRQAVYLPCDNYDQFAAISIAKRTWGDTHFKVIDLHSASTLKEVEDSIFGAFPNMRAKRRSDKLRRANDSKFFLLLVFQPEIDDEQDDAGHGVLEYSMFPDSELVRAILTQFPKANIFVATQQPLQQLRPDFELLDSNFDPEIEYRQYIAYDDTNEIIRENLL